MLRVIALLMVCVSLFGGETYGKLRIEKDHMIDQSTLLYVKLALDQFKEEGVKAVLLELDTPGGEVFSAMKISEMLVKYHEEEKVPVIGYIDDWAISAGSLLAYSCSEIVVNRGSIMGAAEPVMMDGDEVKPASEKTVSALRAEFATTAQLYGRNPDIAEAMVDKDILLVERKGRVESVEKVKRGDVVVSDRGKLLTLRADQLMQLGVADQLVKGSLPQLEGMKPVEFNHWKVGFYAFLTSPMVASLLMMVMMAGFYMEMSSPGFGWPGGLAVGALVLILLTQFTVATAGYLELILLGVGILMVLIEIVAFPGFGLLGILGGVVALVALTILLIPFVSAQDLFALRVGYFAREAILSRVAWLMMSLILACVTMIVLARLFSRKILARTSLVLNETLDKPKASFELKLGVKGQAYTAMRPSGKVAIDGDLYDAITMGHYIEQGVEVEVIAQEGEKVVVKACSGSH